MSDWHQYPRSRDRHWTHPETGIRIADDDMPWELKPEPEEES